MSESPKDIRAKKDHKRGRPSTIEQLEIRRKLESVYKIGISSPEIAARETGINIKTVRKYYKIFNDEIQNIQELRKKTLGKKLFLDVCFYLNDNTEEDGNWQKDLDNLLNAVFDVLPEYFTDEKNQEIDGLGLIKNKSDYMIYEVQAIKKFVNSHMEEGFDIEISEWCKNRSFLSKIKSFFK